MRRRVKQLNTSIAEQKLRETIAEEAPKITSIKEVIATIYSLDALKQIFLPLAELMLNDSPDASTFINAFFNFLCNWATNLENTKTILTEHKKSLTNPQSGTEQKSDRSPSKAARVFTDLELIPKAMNEILQKNINFPIFEFSSESSSLHTIKQFSVKKLMATFYYVHGNALDDIAEHLRSIMSDSAGSLAEKIYCRNDTMAEIGPALDQKDIEMADIAPNLEEKDIADIDPNSKKKSLLAESNRKITAANIHATRAISAFLNFESTILLFVSHDDVQRVAKSGQKQATFRFNENTSEKIANQIIKGVCYAKVSEHPVAALKIEASKKTIFDYTLAAVSYVTVGYNPAQKQSNNRISVCGTEYSRIFVFAQVAGLALGGLHFVLKLVVEYSFKQTYDKIKAKSEIGAELTLFFSITIITTVVTFLIASCVQKCREKKQALNPAGQFARSNVGAGAPNDLYMNGLDPEMNGNYVEMSEKAKAEDRAPLSPGLQKAYGSA